MLIGTSVRAHPFPKRSRSAIAKPVRKNHSAERFGVSGRLSGDRLGQEASEAFAPDDIVKFEVGDLPGMERNMMRDAMTKEDKKDYQNAQAAYAELLKKPGLQERTKRYLTFKKILLTNKMVEELDADKGWKEKAEACVKERNLFLVAEDLKIKSGWEQWFGARANTRLLIELGKYDDAARTWQHVSKNANMDGRTTRSETRDRLANPRRAVRGRRTNAAELLKTATGARKERLNLYAIAASRSDGKTTGRHRQNQSGDGQVKDASVHATGFSMTGELYLAGKKPRDAMNFGVETVMNQDKDEVLKALVRPVKVFESCKMMTTK